MSWTDQQWEVFASILQRGFVAREPFTQDDADVYRLLLDDVDPNAAIVAIKELVVAGQEFRPKPGAIIARTRKDPVKPTFDEAYNLIYGSRGVISARPPRQQGPQLYSSEKERQKLFDDAAIERAKTMHPLIGAFVVRQGLDRLRNLPLNDPQWGDKTRRELEHAWNQHIEAFDGREVTAIAAGKRGRGELQQLDPLAALGVKADRKQLEDAR